MVVDIDIEAIQREWAAVTMDTVVTMARPIIAAHPQPFRLFPSVPAGVAQRAIWGVTGE